MKTIRTILATFGVTSLLYGAFALIAMHNNFAFTGRSIYQLFRDTGFIMLVIGIGCVLSFVIMTIAVVSFRDEGTRKKHDLLYDDPEEEFLEEETVPEENAEEADETWSPRIKRMQRRALRHADEEPSPDLFGDDEPEKPFSFREETQTPQELHSAHLKSSFRESASQAEPEVRAYAAAQAEPGFDPDANVQPFGNRAGEENILRETPDAPERDSVEPEPQEDPLPKTKRCIYCGNTIDADSAFCMYCGKRV